MPRPKKEGAAEPKKRSRHGCWPCKARKIKCGEEKPECFNCQKQGEKCDYSIRLNWEGRTKKKVDGGSSPAWSAHDGRSATNSPNMQPVSPHILGQSMAFPYQPGPPVRNPVGQSFQPTSDPSTTTNAYITPTPSALESPRGKAANIASMDRNSLSPGTIPTSLPPHLRSPPSHAFASQQTQGDSDPPTKKRRVDNTAPVGPFGTLSVHPHEPQQPPLIGLHDPRLTTPQYAPGVPVNALPTPGSSLTSDRLTPPRLQANNPSNDTRRLSVKSLLSNPPDEDDRFTAQFESMYGFDQGREDIDIPRNDDTNALTAFSPSRTFSKLSHEQLFADGSLRDGGAVTAKHAHFEKGGYFAEPVPVKIPKSLEPLPSLLQENPMNLLYFHHFLNHTARLLVFHDCPENPFRTILPQMAVRDTNLLNLFLAYAASHRARLLKHEEPVNRIAVYVRHVFSDLSTALTNSSAAISDATLAAAITLASLEIVSPNTFEYQVTWQTHLGIARSMIVARGGYQVLREKDNDSYFLSRWFAYLDVVGSLTGSDYDRPLSASMWSYDDLEGEDDADIDCIMGFTGRCLTLLAKVGDLVKQCESERRGPDGSILEEWQPTDPAMFAAHILQQNLERPRPLVFKSCSHHTARDGEQAEADATEMVAMNDSYHWAALIHLHRRVLAKPNEHEDVQRGVREIVNALGKVSKSGSAEACMLLPMFTAGCAALDPSHRALVLERMASVESFGLTQASHARALIERSWSTGQPWENLVKGEFLG